MRRVRVWLENDESGRSTHEHFGQIVVAYIPASLRYCGECEATAEAVAELADVDIEGAEEALSHPGERVWVGEIYQGDVAADLYLIVQTKF